METMPTGTVTMLFSDIEGSTVLLSRLGPVYAEVLSGQREVLRAAWLRTAVPRWAPRATASSSCSRPRRPQLLPLCRHSNNSAHEYGRRARSVKVRMGIHTGNPGCLTAATSGWMCIGPRGSLALPTAAKW